MTELCEQLNPRAPRALRDEGTRPMRLDGEMLRFQESWVASAEKRALLWLASAWRDCLAFAGFAKTN